jgi:Na+-driven multidrug efflux pump
MWEIVAQAVPPREVVDAFLAPAAVNTSMITTASGLAGTASLIANAGRRDAHEKVAQAVNAGLVAGFVLSLVPTLATLVIAVQSVS